MRLPTPMTRYFRLIRSLGGLIAVVLFLIGSPNYSLAVVNTFYVSISGNDETGDGSSGLPWRSIQVAIDSTSVTGGDTIIVQNGTFTENVVVTKEVILRSQSGYNSTTLVAADPNANGIEVAANNVTIQGFKIYGAYGTSGNRKAAVFLSNGVTGCTIYSNYCGVDETNRNYYGIYLEYADGNIIKNNRCYWNGSASGIYLNYSHDNTVQYNISNNNEYAGIYLKNSNFNTIRSNTTSTNDFGIYLSSSSNNFLVSNTCSTNTTHGISLLLSDGNALTGNTCDANTDSGMALNFSGNSLITQNTFDSNSVSGIDLDDASGNIIFLNTFTNNTAQNINSGNSAFNTWHSLAAFHYEYNGATVQQSRLGNFYSGHSTTDSDSDGVTDAAYILPGDEPLDNYPLAKTVDSFLSEAWWLQGDLMMIKRDQAGDQGVVNLAAESSVTWISEEKMPAPATFPMGNGTGQLVFETAPENGTTFDISIGYSSNGSDFTPVGLTATITADGAARLFGFTTNDAAFVVPNNHRIALKVTNSALIDYGVVAGGNWSFLSLAPHSWPQIFTDTGVNVGGHGRNLVGDLNNDGFNDVIAGGIYLNDGAGNLILDGSEINIADGNSYRLTDLGDLDNDGDLDFIRMIDHRDIEIWRNDGDGNFTKDDPSPICDISAYIIVADINNDGFNDIVGNYGLSGWKGAILWNQKDGTLVQDLGTFHWSVYAHKVDTADYDNDGDFDFVWSNNMYPNFIEINDGSGIFSGRDDKYFQRGENHAQNEGTAFIDLDSDGLADVLYNVGSGTDSFEVLPYLNNGAEGGFAYTGQLFTGGTYKSPDIDNDGDFDVGPTYLNDGGGILTDIGGDSWSYERSMGDLDGDGLVDFVTNTVHTNASSSTNFPPSIPTGLAVSMTDTSITVSWSPATDDVTPQTLLNYNIKIGTTPGGNELLSGATPGWHPNAGHNTSWTIHTGTTSLSTVYASVQSQDGSYLRSEWAGEVVVSRRQKIVFTSDRSGNSDIWMMNPDGSALEQLTTDMAADSVPELSPDGMRVAFTSERSGNADVWVLNLLTREFTNLTPDNAGFDYGPSWSSDGTEIVFSSRRSNYDAIYKAPSNGGSATKLSFPGNTTPTEGDLYPNWSPDGLKVIYGSTEGHQNNWSIWELTLANGEPAVELIPRIDGGNESGPAYSPDGSQIVWRHNTRTWIADADGQNQREIMGGVGGSPDWSPDGTMVINSIENGDYELWSVDVADQSLNQLTDDEFNNKDPHWGYTIEPGNLPPKVPFGESPVHLAEDVSIFADVSWSGGDLDEDDTVTYDVYFGTAPTPPLAVNAQTALTYDPGALIYNTTYYWQIVTHDNNSSTTAGPVWQFTTAHYPVAQFASLPANLINETGIDITIDGDDITAYKYDLDSNGWSAEIDVNTPITATGLAVGSHTVKVIAKNSSGAWQPQESASTFNWSIDIAKPLISTFTVSDTTSSSQSLTNETTVAVTLSGSDADNSITRWLITENDTVPTPTEMNSGSASEPTSYTIQAAVDGSKTLHAWAMDGALNISTAAQASITLDRVTNVAIDGGDACTPLNEVILTGSLEDGAVLAVDAGSATVGTVTYPTPTTWSTTVSSMSHDTYTVTALATDEAGNQAVDTINLRYSVPTTATIDTGSEDLLADGSGIRPITVTVKDGAGQNVCDGTSFTVTTDLGSISPSTHTTVNGQFMCSLVAAMDLGTATISVEFDSAVLGTGSVEMIPGAISKLAIVAMDNSTIPEPYNIAPDTPSPYLQVQSQDAFGHAVNVAEDIALVLSSTAGGNLTFTPFGGSPTQGDTGLVIAAGTNGNLFKFQTGQQGSVTLSAIEFPGKGWTDALLQVSVGAIVQPEAALADAPTGIVTTGAATIMVGGVDIVAYQYKLDNGEWSIETEVGTAIAISGLADGSHTLYVLGKHATGAWQSGSSPTTATWTVDTTVSVPANPSGLFVETTQFDRIRIGWDPASNPTEVVYTVYRSQTEAGVFYPVNTRQLGILDMSAGKIYFNDKQIKQGITYYYKVRAFQAGIPSDGFSNQVSASTAAGDNYDLRVIEKAHIANIGSTVEYYLQLLPKDKFQGTLNVTCADLPDGVTYDFLLNGQSRGSSLTGVVPIAAVTLAVSAGSSTPVGTHPFTVSVQNVWEGGSSTLKTEQLQLKVEPLNAAGIQVALEKSEMSKGEPVKIYGSILPPIPGRTVLLTVTHSDSSSETRNITTLAGGKFEDADWISTLEIGTHDIQAFWTDDLSVEHSSEIETVNIDKGQVTITCLRKTGVIPETGVDFTILGDTDPQIEWAPIIIRAIGPNGALPDQAVYANAAGHYELTYDFFNAEGIWKFKAYWTGNEDYIGCESDYLVLPVGVDYGRAIILGGGTADLANTYWDVTKKLTVSTYRDFMAKGFSEEMIYLMINSQSIDIDYNDIPDPVVDDDIPTVADFANIVSSHYNAHLDEQTPLFIYMQGHGTSDGRFKVLGGEDFITADQIKDALDRLQGVGAYTGQGGVDCKVILILEACYSGNFIPVLQGPNRVIITSAGGEPYNTDGSGRIAFSRYLFSKLLQGNHFEKAFNWAQQQMVNMGYPSPNMEDSSGGLLAANTYLNGQLTWGLKPEIIHVAAPLVLTSVSSADISAEIVRGDNDVDRVWAQIIAPSANIGGGDTTIDYPVVELTEGAITGTYTRTLTGLVENGIYKVVVLAEDTQHEIADPSIVYISVSGVGQPGDVNGDDSITLEDALLALKVIGGLDTSGETISIGADVNGDGEIGLAEIGYILQKIATMR